MTVSVSKVALASAALLCIACDSNPVEVPQVEQVAGLSAMRAERFAEEYFYDMTDTYYAARCSEDDEVELLRMEGGILEKFTWVGDGAGQYHIQSGLMPVGLKGVGTVSGHEYRVKEQAHSTSSQLSSGVTGNYRQVLKLVSRESGATYEMILRGKYVWDADDIIRVEREVYEVSCRI